LVEIFFSQDQLSEYANECRRTTREVPDMPRHNEESIFRLIEEGPIDPHSVVPAPNTNIQTVVHEKKAAAKAQPSHQNSSQVQSFLKPTFGIRDLQARHGMVPKNHARENLIAIKEKSSQNHLKKLESDLPSPPKKPGPSPWGPKRVTAQAPGPSQRGNNLGGRVMAEGSKNNRDYVHENIAVASRAAKVAAKKEGPKISDMPAEHKHNNFGKVPSYLRERNAELAGREAQRRAAAEAELIPEGMMLLSEEERLKTLRQLADSRKEVEAQLHRLPFNVETPSQIRHKQSVETRLKEIEDAVKVFSRTKVFVRKN